MNLTINLNGHSHQFEFTWKPLQSQSGARCFLWKYTEKPTKNDRAVIYRHVLDVPKVGVVTVYVGEGSSLNGPRDRHLVFQYRNPAGRKTREEVCGYISKRGETGWTELLDLSQPVLDLEDNRTRKLLEVTLIATYYWEHRRLVDAGLSVPRFLNKFGKPNDPLQETSAP